MAMAADDDAGGGTSTTVHHNNAHVTVNVSGGSDPHQVAREAERAVYRAFKRLEADQRSYLSD
jgi:predicted metallopeptidase